MKNVLGILFVFLALAAGAARLFVAASSQSGIAFPIPAAPLVDPITLSAWVTPTTTNANWMVICLQTNDATGGLGRRSIGILGSSGFSGQWAADAFDPGTRMLGPALVPGTTYHVAATFVSSTERYLYVDGTQVANNTTAPTTSFQGHRVLVGMRFTTSTDYGQFADARLSEIAVWNVALSAGQIASLAKGQDPRTVSSTAPVIYWPMLGEFAPEVPYASPLTLTLSNSPAKADHPRIARP